MIELMRDGGVPMWVILAFGVWTLVAAVQFVLRPQPHRVLFVVGLGAATLFATLCGWASAVGAVFKVVTSEEIRHDPDFVIMMLRGFQESLANPLLGFMLLSLSAFVWALGLRRLPPRA